MKKGKKQKPKTKIKKISPNQLEDLKSWLNFYNETKKLPYKKIVCSNCKNAYVSVVGAGLASLKKQFDNDIERILSKSCCKVCRDILDPKEKKVYVPKILTKEEMEDRAEEIRKDLPKIDLNKAIETIDLTKNEKVCAEITASSCWRPDIYLDFGCESCKISKFCSCRLKNLKRKPQNKRGKITYSV